MKLRQQNKFSIILFLAMFILVSSIVHAAPGDLDASFGNGGTVVTPITGDEDKPTRVRIQPDGKIVTVGVSLDGDRGCPTSSFLVRHNADGTVDNSFGTNGSVVVIFGSEEINFQDFVILPDGKLLVTANKFNCVTSTDLFIYRYTANGTLDATFGTNGVITTPLGNETWRQRIVLQPDGKFVVASENFNGISQVAVVRYNPDGTLDATFGTSGITRTSVGSFQNVKEILVQTDGKLLVAGGVSYGSRNIFVLRYNPNGTLDNSFGANGIVQTDIDNLPNDVRGMALQPDGKIIVNCANFSSNFPFSILLLSSSIVHYNANGTLDNTFGTNGIVRITEPPSQYYSAGIAFALAIQQNGKILTAGRRNNTFAISRYNSNGTIDTSFGTNGVVITPFGNGILSIAMQRDGKIVAVGSANYPDDVGLVRYLSDSMNTTRTQFDFDGDGKADVSVFRPSDRVWYLNQSTAGFSATQFGLSTDKITPADFDGDGKTDISVYRDGVWYCLKSSDNSFNAIQFGLADDVPVPSDYTGDGRAELAIYRGGVWWSLNLANNQVQVIQFGLATDKPVVADYDGDGRADQVVYRNGEWHLNQSSQGYAVVNFGLATDKPVIGDYDGDGRADEAVYRDGTLYLLQSSLGYAEFPFGLATDIPAPADYDGDGRVDAAVYRDGSWFLRQSTSGVSVQNFGLPNDKPIQAAYLPQ